MKHAKKDFDGWNENKKEINSKDMELFFHEREVWWCKLGINIGFEQDGKNSQYARPVVILKKYGMNACLTVPLTTRDKDDKYHLDLGLINDKTARAILSQIRFLDKKRLINKVDTISKDKFKELVSAILALNFPQK